MSTPKDHALSSVAADNSTAKTLSSLANPSLLDNQDDKKICHKSLFNLDSLREDLTHFTKLANVQIAESLVISPEFKHAKTAVTMMSCGRFISFKEGKATALNRCHKRICPICNSVRANKYSYVVSRAIKQLGYTFADEAGTEVPYSKQMIGFKVNLNCGETCLLKDLRERLNILHLVWGRLIRTKFVQDCLISGIRSTEIKQCDDPTRANPHIHGLLLVREDTCEETLQGKIKQYWKRAINKALLKATKAKPNTGACFQDFRQLRQHTELDAISWLHYMVKGGYDFTKETQRKDLIKTTPDYWPVVHDAIKGMRLIAVTGDLKELIAKEKATLKEQSPLQVLEHTHTWCNDTMSYIPRSEYIPPQYPNPKLIRKISYALEHQGIGIIAKHALDEHREDQIRLKSDKLFGHFISTSNPLYLSKSEELFINTHKEVKPHHEPTNEHEELKHSKALNKAKELLKAKKQ